MASKEQKKFQKKKDRERRVHREVLAKREELRAPEREERKFQQKVKRITKLKKEMGDLNVWADEVFLSMTDKKLSQLEKNAQILKVLEEEYKQEQNKKQRLNKELEKEGLATLDQKLQFLHDKLVDQAKNLYEEGGLKAEESCKDKEVAEVDVVRMPERMVMDDDFIEGSNAAVVCSNAVAS